MKAEYVDHMGTDLSVVNAARVSFDKVSDWEVDLETCGIKLSQVDTKLINYLARGCSEAEWEDLYYEIEDAHSTTDYGLAMTQSSYEVSKVFQKIKHMATHWTPFTHTAITLRMQAPVPIRTQCFKHKQGFTENEESRRYISGTPELFIPDYFREASKDKKQGSGSEHSHNHYLVDEYRWQCARAMDLYDDMISMGVCPEQARFVLPQGVEVQWIWTGNLASYARFYNQRTDPHAQKEIQDLAKMVGEIIEPLFPVSWEALTNG